MSRGCRIVESVLAETGHPRPDRRDENSRASGAPVGVLLHQRTFEIAKGPKRTIEIAVDEIGSSLRYASVQVTKSTYAKDAEEQASTASSD